MAKATKTPLDEIEEGLASGNLKKIAAGFKKMTGKKVELPKKDAPTPLPKAVVEALSFYGSAKNWQRGGDDFDPKPAPVAADRGVMAAQALLGLDMPGDEDDDEDEAVEFEVALPAADSQPAVLTLPKPAPKPRQNGRIDMSDFEIQHGAGEKNYGRKEPVKPGMHNKFIDDGDTESAASNFDKLVMGRLRPSQRREANPVPATVRVTCSRCDRPYEADPYDVRRSPVSDEADGMSNICPGCIRGVIPRRD